MEVRTNELETHGAMSVEGANGNSTENKTAGCELGSSQKMQNAIRLVTGNSLLKEIQQTLAR